MGETDRQTDKTGKSSRWSFTAFEEQFGLFKDQPPYVAEWGYQEEIAPTSGKRHYQGYLRTKQQVRLTQLRKTFPGVHFEISRNWDALKRYCSKSETAVSGTQVHQTSGNMRTIYSLAKEVAQALPCLDDLKDDYEEIRTRLANTTTRGVEPNYGTYNVSSWSEYFAHRIQQEVRLIIRSGGIDAAWLASNPQWKCMWNQYGEDFLLGIKSNLEHNNGSQNESSCSPAQAQSPETAETSPI